MFDKLLDGENLLNLWLVLFVAAGIGLGVVTGFLKARRIQPGRFKWATFRNEAIFAAVNVGIAGFTLGPLNHYLREQGFIAFQQGPTAWWVIAIEFAAYFFLFDTWFYWLHRWMHKEPVYSWVHKLHHKSTAPNLLTTFSVNPLESFINGGFVPLFLTVATLVVGGVHLEALALIVPTNVIMGLYVHAGHEFLPRWWHKSWATKWFITTTFHDQHHKYFNYNFGGYTQIWDRLCGTMRKKYESDFENPKGRQVKATKTQTLEPASSQSSELAA
ncbi:sterol desaturase family protein [Novosphingobium sp. RD2P27]|uniref:Sterol desaturase family protein n=1 Tax=Novosphingobium kalidii TaxID=3230299 RepID=A0ABV2D3C2_9SPHN